MEFVRQQIEVFQVGRCRFSVQAEKVRTAQCLGVLVQPIGLVGSVSGAHDSDLPHNANQHTGYSYALSVTCSNFDVAKCGILGLEQKSFRSTIHSLECCL